MKLTHKTLMALSALVPFLAQSSVAHGYSSDVFTTNNPVAKRTPADGDDKAASPEQVDGSGAAVQSIAIPTAPSRGGLVPELALTYSSRNPIRGGVAMGWTLSIPRIELDTAQGRLGEPRFKSSMGGRLIRSDDPAPSGWVAFRGQEDDSYTRYEMRRGGPSDQVVQEWRARTTDGRVYYFGETNESRDVPHARSPGAYEGRWFVNRIVDRFGNQIEFHYDKVMANAPDGRDVIPVDIAIESIEYGANPNAGLPHHARVRFESPPSLDVCAQSDVPIGAQLDYRTGYPLYLGARRITAAVLEVTAGGGYQPRRRLDLDYDMDELACAAADAWEGTYKHAPLRILEAVRDTAYAPDGTATVMPPTRFEYNRRERTFDATRAVDASLLAGGMRKTGRGFGRDTTTRMLLDLDGDARVDKLTLDSSNFDHAYCTASYAPNQGGYFGWGLNFGVDAADRYYPVLPTIPWENGTRNDGMEYCSLTNQVSQPVNYATWDPGATEMCNEYGGNGEARPLDAEAQHLFRFMDVDTDGRADLVTAIEAFPLAYRPDLDPRVGPTLPCSPQSCAGDWVNGVGCVIDYPNNQGSCDPERLDAEMVCGNQYVYRVHKNLGGGQFGPAQAWAAPYPLDRDMGADGAQGSVIVDLDGDGLLDAVGYRTLGPSPIEHEYSVYRGLPDGGFESTRQSWPLAPIWGWGSTSGSGWGYVRGQPLISQTGNIVEEVECPPPHDPDDGDCTRVIGKRMSTVGSLEDINGDGLLDYVDSRGVDAIRVFYNNGTGFETYAHADPTATGTRLYDYEAQTRNVALEMSTYGFGAGGPTAGSKTSRSHRMVDFDGDGLQDLIWYGNLLVNLQDRLLHVGQPEALERARKALSAGTIAGRETSAGAPWSQGGDFVDLDGDGLPEAIHDGIARSDSDTQPMRLLKRVDNGRGLTIDYRYRPVSGESVPHVVWVVSDVTSNPGPDADGAPSPTSTTRYEYQGAQYKPDLDGTWGFRGFFLTTVIGPSGARTVTKRSYDQSYAGLVTETRVEDATGHPATITRATYERHVIVGWGPPGNPDVIAQDGDGPPLLVAHHPRTTEVLTCGADQSEWACVTSPSGRRAETRQWKALLTGGLPALWVLDTTLIGESFEPHPGMKGGVATTTLINDAIRYQTTPSLEVSYVFEADLGTVLTDYTWHEYDPSKRVEINTYRSTGDSMTISSAGYDLATGNRTSETAPNQYGTGVQRTFGYDATRTFVTHAVNELGHEVQTLHDPATGVMLEQHGPNLYEGTQQTIDGFGRVLTTAVAVEEPPVGYRMVEIARTTYVDAPRTKVTREARVEIDEDRWARTEVEQDGLGREVLSRTFADATQMTLSRSYFDASGNLVLARVPEPEAWDLSVVEWRFVYDSLGRIVKEVQPARSGCAADTAGWTFCGQTWSYDGLTTTRSDVTGTLGGEVSETTTTQDAFGRLVRVEEATDGDPAVTTYGYDGNDNVREIVSADGVVTTMQHDLLGRRTGITRGARTWSYGYDANGNPTSIVAPHPEGAAPELYTTTIAYDALDRETSRLVGRRDLTDKQLALYGDGMVLRQYDSGTFALGRITGVTQYHGATDLNRTSYSYGARGQVTSETRYMSVLGGRFASNRTTTREYTAQGQLKRVTAADGATEAASTQFVYGYDGRGLPYVVYAEGFPGPIHSVARTSSGALYYHALHTGSSTVARSLSSIDELGRVNGYRVLTTLPGQSVETARALEGFTFDGAGNVSAMQTGLWPDAAPTAPSVWAFGYDPQHQLTSATGALGYRASFDYTPGGKLTRADVLASPAATRVHDRAVDYTYGDGVTADPDAPIALGDGSVPWMAIGYDLAGNATTRTIAGESYQLRYDGSDLQREVLAPDGSREVSWYGADRMRTLVADYNANGILEQVRWSFGEAEIWFAGDGSIEREAATTSIEGHAARIVDHERREIMFTDPRGHMLAAVDDAGVLRAGFHYGPYGELLEEAGSESDKHLHRFNGKQWSKTSGLSYYGYRSYDEYSLSWTQADPYFRIVPDVQPESPRRASLYQFSLNNPVRMSDPDGRNPEDDYSWSLHMVKWIEPDNNDGVPKVVGKALAAIPVGIAVAVVAVNEFAITEARGFAQMVSTGYLFEPTPDQVGIAGEKFADGPVHDDSRRVTYSTEAPLPDAPVNTGVADAPRRRVPRVKPTPPVSNPVRDTLCEKSTGRHDCGLVVPERRSRLQPDQPPPSGKRGKKIVPQ